MGKRVRRRMSAFAPCRQVRAALHADALSKALVAPVEPRDLLSAGACVAAFDPAAMAPADADFTAPFELCGAAGRAGGAGPASAAAGADDQVRLQHACTAELLVTSLCAWTGQQSAHRGQRACCISCCTCCLLELLHPSSTQNAVCVGPDPVCAWLQAYASSTGAAQR